MSQYSIHPVQHVLHSQAHRPMRRADFVAFANYILVVMNKELKPGRKLNPLFLLAKMTDAHDVADVCVVNMPEGDEAHIPAKAATLLHVQPGFDIACLITEGSSLPYSLLHSLTGGDKGATPVSCVLLTFYGLEEQAFLKAYPDAASGELRYGELVVVGRASGLTISEDEMQLH